MNRKFPRLGLRIAAVFALLFCAPPAPLMAGGLGVTGQGGSINTVTDSTHTVYGPYQLKVSGGTVSNPSPGVAQITVTGGGSGCTTAGSSGNIVTDNGSGGCNSDANANLTAGALSLGASGTAGSVALGNATSGTVTVQPVTGALGTVTASLPANTGTIAELNLAQTWAAVQSYNDGNFSLKGSASGTLVQHAAGTAGSSVLTWPAGTTDFTGTGGASQVVRQSSSGAALTVGQLAGSDLTAAALANGMSATTQAATDNTTKIATDAYVTTAVANAIAGVNPAVAVQAATTAAGDTSGLAYNNGVSGIGATLTGSNNTALVIDGYTFTALAQRLLVKNDTQSPSGAFNGVYYVTQVQTAILPPILTRALDYDMPSDINNTGAIPVINGTVNASTSWLLTSAVNTVGTDPLTYTQFTVNPTTLVVGPASATDGNFAYFNGTTGKLIKNGGTPAASATTDTTNASNISSGSLPVGRFASAASHGGLVDVAGTATWKVIPDCTDTTGNHLNYTQSSDAYSCGTSSSGGSSAPTSPLGRLTLVSATPVMISDQTAKTTIYYDSYIGNQVPVYSGSAMVGLTIGSDEISMGLDAVTPHITSGSLYDVFGFSSTGTLTICAGPAWSSATARGTGAGTTEIALQTGVWTNKNALTHCWGGASGTTDFGSISANQATYLGTFLASANGQTGVSCKPAGGAGGSNPFVNLWNAYNRVPGACVSIDTNTAWTYSTNTWRPADGATANTKMRVSVVDGLGVVAATCTYMNNSMTGATTRFGLMGCAQTSTSATPSVIGTTSIGTGAFAMQMSTENFYPLLGSNYYQAMESGGAGCSGGSCVYSSGQMTPAVVVTFAW